MSSSVLGKLVAPNLPAGALIAGVLVSVVALIALTMLRPSGEFI